MSSVGGFARALVALSAVFAIPGSTLWAKDMSDPQIAEAEREAGRKIAADMSEQARQLCVFDGGAPSDVQVKRQRRLKVAKGTYGGVKDLLPDLARQALAQDADAIVDYNSAQRFGFWPWRLVRPVVTGTAVQWRAAPSKSCEEMGGVRLVTILERNLSPEAMDAPNANANANANASAGGNTSEASDQGSPAKP